VIRRVTRVCWGHILGTAESRAQNMGAEMFSEPATLLQDDWTGTVNLVNHDKATRRAFYEIWITWSAQRSLHKASVAGKIACIIRDLGATCDKTESRTQASSRRPVHPEIVPKLLRAQGVQSDLADPFRNWVSPRLLRIAVADGWCRTSARTEVSARRMCNSGASDWAFRSESRSQSRYRTGS